MVRVRSLAKELKQLERQKQTTASATPPPPASTAHADPTTREAKEEEEDAAAPSTNTTTTTTAALTSAGLKQASQEGSSARHAASPPAQTEEVTSAASSSSGAEGGTAAAQPAALDPCVLGSASSSSAEAEPDATGGSHQGKRDRVNIFALGGSRFDILMNGSYGDGVACRKSEVRRATKVCSSGKDALQREAEEGSGAEAAEATKPVVDGEPAGATGAASLPPPPPPPPAGTSCGIPSRSPFKRLLPQPFSHILVCDFEATCASGSVHYPHEIIEFPVVVLDTATLRIAAEFHRYVKPIRNPTLTPFCTELTGITQAMVDQADTLPVVVAEFQQWLEAEVYPLCAQWALHYGPQKLSHNLKSEQKRFVYDERTEESRANAASEAMICFATDGPWDMRRFMHECSVMRDGVEFPPVCYRYVNVRHSYGEYFKCRQVKLTHMLRKMSMSFEGRRHSGIDDTRNITRVLAELMARGYRVHHVSTIKYAHRGDAFLASNAVAQELLSEFGEKDQTHTSRHGNAQKGPAKGGKGRK